MNKALKLEYLSAAQIGRLVNAKTITPTEVLQYFEKRIKERNPSINAFVYTKFDEAYEKAKELEERLARGEYCGPFAGVPFALKDFLPSKQGWTHSKGGVKCLIREDPYTGTFCQAMEDAGGIAIGKCNAPAYGFRGTTDNKLYGPTSTPFDIRYNAGGSSGGSAAAVADGLVPIAEGGDAGGSIRVPAACCNLVGFKAGVGTIVENVRPDGYSITHPYCHGGGECKTVEDAAILLNYMAKYDPRDPNSYERQIPINYIDEINETNSRYINLEKAPLKIAFTTNFDLFEVEQEVADKVREAAMKFRDAGAIVEEVHFNFKHTAKEFSEQWCKGITIDCALEVNHDKKDGWNYLEEHPEDFPEEFLYWKKVCDNLGIEDLYKFNLARTDILDNFEDIFEEYDLIISPVMCCLPVKNANNRNTKGPDQINGKPVEGLIGWCETFLVNFVGNPAASIPAGLSNSGLPIGMQIIGRRHHDEDVLKSAKLFENIQPWVGNFEKAFNRM